MKIYRNKHSDTDRLQKVACRMITRRGCIPENQKVVVTSAKRANSQIPFARSRWVIALIGVMEKALPPTHWIPSDATR